MRLTVVGCSGSFPGPDSPASSYLLEVPDGEGTFRVLLDLGNGALGALQRHVDPYAIDAVLVSHLHADHFLDLCSYYVARRYRPGGHPGRLPVMGPKGTAERLARAYDLPADPGMSGEFDIAVYPESGTFALGPLAVRVARVAHPVETYAIRLEADGSSLVYSGDTGPSDALVELARGADAALFEAAFRDGGANPPDLHLTGRQAGEHARRAGVGRLLVTHVPPWHEREEAVSAAAETFDGPVSAALPDLDVTI